MEEIYWITRLDYLQGLFIVLTLICGFLVPISCIMKIASSDEEEVKIGTAIFKYSLPVLILSAIGICFVPSTKEMLLIYGVGGTVDYIKKNETIQQLPDKCIEALDLFIDDYIEEEKDGNKN